MAKMEATVDHLQVVHSYKHCKKKMENKTQATLIIWKVCNPHKLACKWALSGGSRPSDKKGGGGGVIQTLR